MTAIFIGFPNRRNGFHASEREKLVAAVILVIGCNVSFFVGHNEKDLEYFNWDVGKVISTKFETTAERFHLKKYKRKSGNKDPYTDKYTFIYYLQKNPTLIEIEQPIDFDQKEIIDEYQIMPYNIQLHKNNVNSYKYDYHDYDIVSSDKGTIYGTINVTELATISVVSYTWYLNKLPQRN